MKSLDKNSRSIPYCIDCWATVKEDCLHWKIEEFVRYLESMRLEKPPEIFPGTQESLDALTIQGKKS